MNIGILGSSGFIGKSLCSYILAQHEYSYIHSKREYFNDKKKLAEFVNKCDCIFLLSALCRGEETEIYNTNMYYVKRLIETLIGVDTKKTVVFLSSIQESEVTAYGRSKRDGRLLLSEKLRESGHNFLGLILPNIFGPLAKVNYASFIATFASNIVQGLENKVIIDRKIDLLYVDDLVREMLFLVENKVFLDKFEIQPRFSEYVSYILARLTELNKAGLSSVENSLDSSLLFTLNHYRNEL